MLHLKKGNAGCALFLVGMFIRTVTIFETLVSLDATMPVASHAIDSLLWVLGAIITAALLSLDCDRITPDTFLVTDREFLNGKIRTVWRAFAPLLAGWYAADVFASLLLVTWETPLRLLYHILLISLNVSELHIILLLGAVGATFGRSTTSRIVSSLLWSVPGLLVPTFAGDYLEYRLVSPTSSQNHIEQFGMFVLAYTILVGAALVLSQSVARWRFRQLWKGVCG